MSRCTRLLAAGRQPQHPVRVALALLALVHHHHVLRPPRRAVPVLRVPTVVHVAGHVQARAPMHPPVVHRPQLPGCVHQDRPAATPLPRYERVRKHLPATMQSRFAPRPRAEWQCLMRATALFRASRCDHRLNASASLHHRGRACLVEDLEAVASLQETPVLLHPVLHPLPPYDPEHVLQVDLRTGAIALIKPALNSASTSTRITVSVRTASMHVMCAVARHRSA